MRKTIFSLILLAAALNAGAQTMYDALTFGETNYYGTARSMALGNAMTAVGGDLGGLGINPAGSAVSPYGQLVLTPGASFANNMTTWSMLDDGNYSAGYKDGRSRFTFPNSGFTMNIETGNRRGVKRYSFGFVANTTVNHLSVESAAWSGNSFTSMAGSFAANASGVPVADLMAADPYNNTNYPWNTVMAQRSDMIATYDTYTDQYLGVTECIDTDGSIHVAGPLSQRAVTRTTGSNTDMVMNFAMDISDKLFVGFNLGVTAMRYNYGEGFIETAMDPDDFPLVFDGGGSTNFKSSRYQYNYIAEVSGIYAKLGLIYVPVKGVRLGAAIKTPTALSVEERWQVDGIVNYTSASSSSSTSPQGEWAYNLRSPWEANFGAAITVGRYGLLSVDYEMTDYSVMRFREQYDEGFYSGDPYYNVNRLNQIFCGVRHSLRVGAEVKPIPALALRAGFGLATSPERTWTDNLGLEVTATDYDNDFDNFENGTYSLVSYRYNDATMRQFSVGAGYSSKGSFFADIAFRVNKYPATWRKPYADYIYDGAGKLDTASPVIRNQRTLMDMAVTFGWRF